MATNNSGNTNPKNTTYNYTPPSGSRSSKKNDQKGDIPWWLIIVLLFSWTPAGFMLLFAKLFLMLKNGQLNSVSAKAKTASSHTGTKHAFGTNAADKTAKVKTPGKALGIFLKVFGGILIGSGIIALFTAIDSLLYWGWDSYVASEFLDAALVGLGGIVSFIAGQNNTRR